MEKYLPQTKLRKFLGCGRQLNPVWLENLKVEKEKKLEDITRVMDLKYCGIVNRPCMLGACVHFEKGKVTRTLSVWGYYELVAPLCKLWCK